MEWIEHNLFRCLFKTLTGWDCPGCGFQRSILSLIKGDIQNSFFLYPATTPILLLIVWSIIRTRYTVKNSEMVTRAMVLVSASTIVLSYAVKLANAGN
ncbi:DUF2752 domain-containing protein [Daejeonella sp.]|uniref:DUF2752 domain-containing protein n=1 Tax=Daejeonella sp. TaxID=2805397 RepID=UPI0030C3672D